MHFQLLTRVAFALIYFASDTKGQNDPCQNYSTISDSWRNVGFYNVSFTGRPKNDQSIKEGWYGFSGIGGADMVYSCPIDNKTTIKNILNSSADYYSTLPPEDQCNTVINNSTSECYTTGKKINTLNCSGLFLYYLVPTLGIYFTRHSACTPSSCGENAMCGLLYGSCVCDPGLSISEYFQPSKDSYGCTDLNLSQSLNCQESFTLYCVEILLNQTQSNTAQVIPQIVVVNTLEKLMASTEILENEVIDQTRRAVYGNAVLKSSEKLVSALFKKTNDYYVNNVTVPALEVAVFGVGPLASRNLTKTPLLNTSNAVLEIDLIGISWRNNGSASVALMSYTNMSVLLQPKEQDKTLISNVVSVVLYPNYVQIQNHVKSRSTDEKADSGDDADCKDKCQRERSNSPLFNVSITPTKEWNSEDAVTCVNWNEDQWVRKYCETVQTNNGMTCSCTYPGTIALLMSTGTPTFDGFFYLLNLVVMAVGLFFLTVTLLTFAFCRGKQRITKTALTNLCLCLLLAHLLYMLTQGFLVDIKPLKVVCASLAGVLHFLYLCAFVWMFIEAVLMLISVRNITKVMSEQTDVLSWKYLLVIGYIIPVLVVGVSAGLFPDGYGDENCWIKTENQFRFAFLGPVYFILTSNVIFFIIIFIYVTFALRSMNSKILQMKQTKANRSLIKSVIFKTMCQFFILGCPWILQIIPNKGDIKVLDILYFVFNSQQGTFMFLIHCVFNSEVRQQYKQFFCRSPAVRQVQEEQAQRNTK